ncbi:hypothetical protein IW261DRAFT_1522071, partial [Armillaria novae-zelandiae]
PITSMCLFQAASAILLLNSLRVLQMGDLRYGLDEQGVALGRLERGNTGSSGHCTAPAPLISSTHHSFVSLPVRHKPQARRPLPSIAQKKVGNNAKNRTPHIVQTSHPGASRGAVRRVTKEKRSILGREIEARGMRRRRLVWGCVGRMSLRLMPGWVGSGDHVCDAQDAGDGSGYGFLLAWVAKMAKQPTRTDRRRT